MIRVVEGDVKYHAIVITGHWKRWSMLGHNDDSSVDNVPHPTPASGAPMTSQAHAPTGLIQTLRTTHALAVDPYAFYQGLFAEHGDTERVRSINGQGWVTRDPEVIKAFFAHDPEDYGCFAAHVLAPVLGARSLLAIDGPTHRSDRKLMMPSFHGSRMKSYAQVMARIAKQSVDELTPGQHFTAHALATKVSQEIILHAVFGINEDADLASWRDATSRTIDRIRPSMLFMPAAQRGFLGLTPWDRFRRNAAALDDLIFAELDRRRSEDDAGQDIMSMLMEARYEDDSCMTDEDLRDQLLTLLFAGYETTAVSLAWAMHDLHHHPEARARAVEEARALEDDPLLWSKAPYIKACWQESMRRSPIVPDILRVAKRDVHIAGIPFMEGEFICVSISGLHHHPGLYDDPHRYDPERFLTHKPSPWEFIPFGGGHRRCIGAAFAAFEMSIVLTAWLRQASFELLDARPARPVRRSITIAPSTGVRMKVR